MCGGIDAPGHFLHQNKVNWFPKYFYDTADFLAGPLSLLHSADVLQEFCLGPEKGDLLGLDVCSMARVSLVAAGRIRQKLLTDFMFFFDVSKSLVSFALLLILVKSSIFSCLFKFDLSSMDLVDLIRV